MPNRENSPESLNSQKRLYSNNMGRGLKNNNQNKENENENTNTDN